ncbi:MAG: hypothetical protein FWE98_08550 [Oscillospiraceae bacterium]|nr:hypothetical protein [Oscillospiraceae bacterium]
MNLREQDARNLREVIFRERELGEWHRIDGRRVKVIVDNDALRSRQDLGGVAGLHTGNLLYFARASDLPKRPEPGSIQKFDGRNMRVVTCNEDVGMLEVTLSQMRQGGL